MQNLGAVGVAGDVDEQVAEQAVDQPRRRRVARARRRHLLQGDFQLVERVVPGLVDARGLAGRADEQAGEQVGDRRVALPVQNEAAQQVRAAQERRIERGGAADDDVVAATGAGVLAVDHELVGAEAALARLVVDGVGDRDAVLPRGRGMDVDLDDARIGGDADDVHPRVVRGRVALDVDGEVHLLGGRLGGGDEVEIVLDALDRGHEHAEPTVAGLDGEGGADDAAGLAEFLLDLGLLGAGVGGEMRHRLGAAAVDRLRRLGRRRALAAAEVGKCAALDRRVDDVGVGVVRRGDVGKLAERQAEADRAVAGNEVEEAAAELPLLRTPVAAAGLRLPRLHRQDVARGRGQPAVEDLGDAVPLLGVLELRVLRGDVGGQIALLEDPLARILVGRRHHLRFDAEFLRDALQQPLGLDRAGVGLGAFLGDEPRVLPDRRVVAAPVEREGPARQALARIPLALAVVEKAAGGETVAEAADQLVGEPALLRADGLGVPLRRLEVVDRDEGRLPAHGQADVAHGEAGVDLAAEGVQRRPRLVRIGLGDPRVLGDAGHLHLEAEVDLGEAGGPGDRRGVAIMRRRGERDVALAGQQAARRVEADPAGTGQIDLAPRMQVGEVVVGARRPVDGDEVGLQLDQVARDEAGGEAEVAQDLDEQPRGVPARAGAALEGLLGRLDAGLHADDVADLAGEAGVEADDEVDGAGGVARDGGEEALEMRPDRLGRADR